MSGSSGGNYDHIPGHFPIETNVDPISASPEETVEDSQASRYIKRILAYIFQFPLMILFYSLTVLLQALKVIKPLKNLLRFYDKKHINQMNHRDVLARLIEYLEKETEKIELNRDHDSSNYSFGSLYGTDSGSLNKEIMQGSYTQLLDTCTDQLKFGMIYLHDPLLDDSLNYLDKILCSEDFVKLLKRYQILLWFGDVTNSEGMQVSNALKVRSFPFLGVLTVKNNKKIELFGKFEGPVHNFTAASLENILSKEYPSLLQLRQQKQHIEVERFIREQQDARFNDSLRRDQERERARLEEQNRAAYEAEQTVLRKQWLLWRKKSLKSEPNSSQDSSRIAIRMEDGSRIVRKFDAGLPIEEIYAFVELYSTNLLQSEEQYDAEDPPSNYHHSYNFTLIVPVPRKELNPAITISDESSIYPSGTIIIEIDNN
ncbi:hypothetical protein B1J92_L07128g [Nakaseomyces glabratus]|nr:hypothetical protein B1J91_L07128g [Nakaseomyces glabratus]OXB46194.1 hypothetical protein B1J92_L07128g [Nakaseomyces glabratus]